MSYTFGNNIRMEDLSSIFACPQCTFNRYMPSWYLFVFLRFAAIAVVTYKRLDIVRLLFIYLAFEVAYFYVWRMSVVDGYAEIHDFLPKYAWAPYAASIYESSLLYMIVIIGVSRIKFFRGRHSELFVRWRVLLLLPMFVLIALLHTMVASSTPSH